MTRRPPKSTLFPYPPLSRSNTIPCPAGAGRKVASVRTPVCRPVPETVVFLLMPRLGLGLIGRPHERLEIVHDESEPVQRDRKSTRLNSSHGYISYAVFCLKK